jgi:phosphoglycerate dehydrogenase-like enzyme
MTYRILLSAPYMIPFVERFKPVFAHYGLEVVVPDVHERMEEEQILEYAGGFDGTICGDDRYSERVIEACLPRLKVISKWGTGIDSLDQKTAAKHGVMIGNTTNAFTLPVADTVMGYVLAFARKQPWMDRQIRAGEWVKIPGRSLSECTLGVIGIGNIGSAVVRRARAFGMRMLCNDIVPLKPDFVQEMGVEEVKLDELLSQADFVSVNCDLNPTSFHLITTETLEKMKSGAILINTARGPIVDEPALVRALKDGKIAGAALDVFELEPLPVDSPLREMDQVMLGAHNSNSSPSAWERVHWNTIRNLLIGLDIDYDDLDDFKAK